MSIYMWRMPTQSVHVSRQPKYVITPLIMILTFSASLKPGFHMHLMIQMNLQQLCILPLDIHCKTSQRPHGRDDRVGTLHKQRLKLTQEQRKMFTSFECMNRVLVLIYRPPPSKKNKLTISMFLVEFVLLLEDNFMLSSVKLMLTDFDIHKG